MQPSPEQGCTPFTRSATDNIDSRMEMMYRMRLIVFNMGLCKGRDKRVNNRV